MSELLSVQLDEGVLHVCFNRPEKKNAINTEMWIALRDAFLDASTNPEVSCVLLTGAGDSFCSGVDLASFGEVSPEGAQPFESAARAIAHFDKPMVGAAQGVAVGGGATILFHCDVLYVGESLRMRLPFANLGLVPEFASSYKLQVNIGAQQAAELFYTAEWIDAAKAVEVGIAARSFGDSELQDKAMEKAREIAQWPVNALQETKRCLQSVHREAIDRALDVEAAAMERQAGSPENIEAITAFMEKRPPDFRKLL